MAKRLHWHTEDTERRRQIAEIISSFGLLHTVVVGAPVDRSKPERARRLCMERLYFELHGQGVTHVCVEARDQSLNRRDLRMIDALRGKGTIPKSFRVEFSRPSDEPMLWIPDAVAGAVGAARVGEDLYPSKLLAESLTVIDLRLS
jgi:hypothetical protein